jgi:hypothetical protein
MSERPDLDQIGKWARTFFADVKQGLENGWNKVYGEYKEKFAQTSEQPVPRKRKPGLEDSETVVTHEEGAEKATKKAKK